MIEVLIVPCKTLKLTDKNFIKYNDKIICDNTIDIALITLNILNYNLYFKFIII